MQKSLALERDLKKNRIITRAEYQTRLRSIEYDRALYMEVVSSKMEYWLLTSAAMIYNDEGSVRGRTFRVQRPKGSWLMQGGRHFKPRKGVLLACSANLVDRD